MFKRKIYNELLDWKNNYSKDCALLIEGARRIGKSTIVEEFAKNEYKSYILIDFNDVSNVVLDAFNNYLNNLDYFFMILSTEYNKKLIPNDTLIIFDEIQKFPKARQSIKKLVKDGRFSYIETGSLISIQENVKDITIPSEEKCIQMYPLDFEEFAWALNEEKLIDYIKDCFNNKKPLLQDLHKRAMLVFKQYMLVGGMPKVVKTYLDSNMSFVKADDEKRKIISLYKNDIDKADVRYKTKIKSIFEQIPAFLSKHEKRVRLSNLDENSKFPLYQDTFYWLKTSMMTTECYLCNDPNVGLSLNEERSYLKCYMGDTGLLVSLAFDKKELANGELYKEILHDNLSLNEGMLFENVVAQILTANNYKLFFYTHYNVEKHRNDMEIDFIISNGSKLKPKIYSIEVKSGKRYTAKSITLFKEKYKSRIGDVYIIHPKNLAVVDGVICIPAYMSFCL